MNAINTEDNVGRFQILSLDGGGIKGIFSAAILAAIEDDLDTRITDHFDLITGTSTGGIIAIGLGLGLRPCEIVEFYLREGPKIFPRWFGIKALPNKSAIMTFRESRHKMDLKTENGKELEYNEKLKMKCFEKVRNVFE